MTTLVLVEQLIQEYMEGNTNFSVTKKPITQNDIPTATICIHAKMELNYGKDFNIMTLNTTSFGLCAVSNKVKIPKSQRNHTEFCRVALGIVHDAFVAKELFKKGATLLFMINS